MNKSNKNFCQVIATISFLFLPDITLGQTGSGSENIKITMFLVPETQVCPKGYSPNTNCPELKLTDAIIKDWKRHPYSTTTVIEGESVCNFIVSPKFYESLENYSKSDLPSSSNPKRRKSILILFELKNGQISEAYIDRQKLSEYKKEKIYEKRISNRSLLVYHRRAAEFDPRNEYYLTLSIKMKGKDRLVYKWGVFEKKGAERLCNG